MHETRLLRDPTASRPSRIDRHGRDTVAAEACVGDDANGIAEDAHVALPAVAGSTNFQKFESRVASLAHTSSKQFFPTDRKPVLVLDELILRISSSLNRSPPN